MEEKKVSSLQDWCQGQAGTGNWDSGHEDVRNAGPLKYKDVFDYLQDSVPVLIMRTSHKKQLEL